MVQTRHARREAEARAAREESERQRHAEERRRAKEARYKEMGRRRREAGSWITAGQPIRLPKGRKRSRPSRKGGKYHPRGDTRTKELRGCPHAQWVPGYYRCAAPWQVV